VCCLVPVFASVMKLRSIVFSVSVGMLYGCVNYKCVVAILYCYGYVCIFNNDICTYIMCVVGIYVVGRFLSCCARSIGGAVLVKCSTVGTRLNVMWGVIDL
jgi:hypothetical protein